MPTRRSFVTLTVVAAASVAAALAAPLARAEGSLVQLEILDRSHDGLLPVYRHRGVAWVAGRPGSRYAIRLTNRSAGRVLVVLSVDGVNAVSGGTADVQQAGYVLSPYQTFDITGWRKSLTEAAAFYFTALPDSYAARTGRPDNVGVIGAAVFTERRHAPQVDLDASQGASRRIEPAELRKGNRAGSDESSALASAAAKSPAEPMRDERLGTGHGEREYAPTIRTTFERASERPAELIRLRYDSHANLVASGVLRPGVRRPAPEPFPPAFVPDPNG